MLVLFETRRHGMDPLDFARWQFGITTVYHFFFVPITIGTGFLVAGMQTRWVMTGDERWLRATKFFGKLLLINFAMGVVTGILQEFQFGMNWSDFSRYVGDIFGAPLAIEALLTFFLESVFLGLWIFGWDKLPKAVHLATIWLFSIVTAMSAYMILAANAFMQHPVGYEYNAATNRAEMTNFLDVMFQNTAVVAWIHTISAAFLTAGTLMAGVSLYLVMRGKSAEVAHKTLRVGAVAALISFAVVAFSGDSFAKIMVQQQPMKIAAAEALYESEDSCAPFSVFTIGTLDGSEPLFALELPCLLSFLATGSFEGPVEGINPLEQQYQQEYGSEFPNVESFTPYIPITYWGFRLMIGLGGIGLLGALFAWWLSRKHRTPKSRWWLVMAVVIPFLPLLGNSFGWIFTEMGRQPWVVFGLLPTQDGVSPGVAAGEVISSLVIYTALYGVLAVIEIGLLLRAIKKGPEESIPDPFEGGKDRELTITY